MKSLPWIGTALSALAGTVNPWLAAYGMTIVLLIVIVICMRDVIVAYITNLAVKHNDSKKHNKKNR